MIIAPHDGTSRAYGAGAAPGTPIGSRSARPLRNPRPTDVAVRADTRARALLVAQEDERRQLARDLHDVVGGALTAVKLSLEAAARQNDIGSAGSAIGDSVVILQQAIQAVRELSLDLRPSILDDLGLVPAIRWCLVREARRSGIQASLLAAPSVPRLDPDLESSCFRVVQEALANAVKHAHASHVRIEIRMDADRLVLIVEDDGVGFDLRHALKEMPLGGIQGLQEMTERMSLLGGTLDVMSEVDGGTRVQASVPVAATAAQRRTVKR